MKTFTTIYPRGNSPTKRHATLADALRYALSTNVNGVVVRVTETGYVLGSTRTDEDLPGISCCSIGFNSDCAIKYAQVTETNPVTYFQFDFFNSLFNQLVHAGYELGYLAGIPIK